MRAYFYELANAISALMGSHGQVPIGGSPDKVWGLMGWDLEELEDA